MATVDEMVAGVRAWALDHYEVGGWDFVVECWADDEIAHVIADCDSVAQAIDVMREQVGVLADYRREIQSTVW